jgi:hypothetical protein
MLLVQRHGSHSPKLPECDRRAKCDRQCDRSGYTPVTVTGSHSDPKKISLFNQGPLSEALF